MSEPVASSGTRPLRPSLVDAAGMFLAGTDAVRTAVASEAVGAAWRRPSVLEQQTVGGLAGHLARTGGWIVHEYLDLPESPEPVAFESAGEYYATLMDTVDAAGHQAIRDRGAAIGSAGQDALVAELDARLTGLADRLGALDEDATLAAYGGSPMFVRDYLVTRIVEQVVHLDDLARSVGAATGAWAVPRVAIDLVIAVGVDVARRRRGDTAVLRAIYRAGEAEAAFPAL